MFTSHNIVHASKACNSPGEVIDILWASNYHANCRAELHTPLYTHFQ